MSEEPTGAPVSQPETPPQARAANVQPTKTLQQQNDRLQLLLTLTNSVTSSLDLKDVLQAIAAKFREVMRCDAAGISLPGRNREPFVCMRPIFPAARDSSGKNGSSCRAKTARQSARLKP